MKYLFLDTETTGLDKEKCAIHQLSGFIIIDDEIKEIFDFKIKPFEHALIEKNALEINNLTIDDLNDNEHLPQEVIYRKFIDLLDKYVNKYNKEDKFFLVGYNVIFDKDFLYNFFVRNNNNYLFSYIWSNHLDVMVLATYTLLKYRKFMMNFKQSTVADYLNIEFDRLKLHNSLEDVYICLKIYEFLTKKEFTINEKLKQQLLEN